MTLPRSVREHTTQAGSVSPRLKSQVLLGEGWAVMPGHQHDIAIALIVVFGIETGAALVYLLYKRARPFFSLVKRAGSPLRLRFRRASPTPESVARERGRAPLSGSFAGATAAAIGPAPEPSGKAETNLVDLRKLLEQVAETITEVHTTVKEVKTTVKDSDLKLDGVSTKVTEASTTVTEASTKVDGVASDVTEIRRQLNKAGHAAVFWNVSSFVFGVAGVAIGIITLHS